MNTPVRGCWPLQIHPRSGPKKPDPSPGTHPPLISAELFEQVQLTLNDQSRSWNRRHGWSALLHGFARCNDCDTLVSTDRHKKWLYYRCRAAGRSQRRCHSRVTNVAVVHAQLEAIYEKMPVIPAILDAIRQARLCRHDTEVREAARQRELLDRHRADQHVREARLAQALAEGFLDPGLYRLTVAKLRHDIRRMETEVHAAPALRHPDVPVDSARTILELHTAFRMDDQRALVELLFDRIWIDYTGIRRYEFRSLDRAATVAA